MFRLFASTRKQLLSENRLTRYIVYASGEIVLIVLGILLALQISIWNEESNEQKAINSYLTSIARNLEQDITELKRIRAKKAHLSSLRPY